MKIIIALLILIAVSDINADSPVQIVSQSNNVEKPLEVRKMFVETQLYRQGGVGLVGDDTFVVANSNNNEIIFHNRTRWIGKDKNSNQIVYLVDGKIYDPTIDKNNHSITGCILVSFESKKIYVFDFRSFEGGYFIRD
jgi:hypothetical protein